MNCGFEDCTALIEILEKNKNDWQKTLNEYEAARKPNAQAIADMALENFVEMRDKVGDPQFLERKKIESLLEKQYPDLYISRYGMITYTLVPYALAQKAGIKQNEIINQLSKDISSADKIIKSDWSTFVKENNLDIKKFRA
jgi:kynurenine 3-monooxygenase